MSRAHFIVFIWIFVITNSCVHHRITFGDKHQKKAESAISESSVNQIENDVQTEGSRIESETASREPENRIIDFVERNVNNQEAEKIIQKTKSLVQREEIKNNSDKGFNDSKKNRNENPNGGLVFTLIGAILIFLCVVFLFLGLEKIANNESTVDGCITSVIMGTMLIILGSVIGAVGLALLIIGIVFFATGK